jgi:hypothetical protein
MVPTFVTGSWTRFLIWYWAFWFTAAILVFWVSWNVPWLVAPLVVANNWWAQGMLDFAIARAPYPISWMADWILWGFNKLQDLVVWMAKRRSPAQYREHITLIGKMYFQPGGLALISEVAIGLGYAVRKLTEPWRMRRIERWIDQEVTRRVKLALEQHVALQAPPPTPEPEWIDLTPTTGPLTEVERQALAPRMPQGVGGYNIPLPASFNTRRDE